MSYPPGYPYPQNPYPSVPPLPDQQSPMGFQQHQQPYPQSNLPYPTTAYPNSPYPPPVYPPNPQVPYPTQGQCEYPPQQNFQQMHSTYTPAYPTNPGQYPTNPGQYPTNPGQYPASYPTNPGQYATNCTVVSHEMSHAVQQINLDSDKTIIETQLPKSIPTIVPANPFSPRADAEALRNAMKGFGTDEAAIISILAHRTNLQRVEIASQYTTLFGKDLVKQLRSELGGNFENLVVASLTPLPTLYARDLNEAISGIGTKEDTLIEVLCTLENSEIRAIKNEYEKLFKKRLESDLKGDTSGSFQRLLVSLCQGNRDEDSIVDVASAKNDATKLFSAGEGKCGTDETTFNMILASRSIPQLRQIFTEYEAISKKSLEQVIKSEFSGSIEQALLAVVKSIRNRADYFAERLYTAVSGLGTKDRALIRLIVTRAEIDMGDIKLAFQTKYNKTLMSEIQADTSGDYQKMLIAMIS